MIKDKINVFWNDKMVTRTWWNNWYNLSNDWTIKFRFWHKNHLLTSFKLSRLTFNPTIESSWKFTKGLLTYYYTWCKTLSQLECGKD